MAKIRHFKLPEGKTIDKDTTDEELAEVVQLASRSDSPMSWSVVQMLRTLADDIDAGDLEVDSAVVVFKGVDFNLDDTAVVMAQLEFTEAVYALAAAQSDLLHPVDRSIDK